MGSTTCRDGRTSQQFQGKVYGYHACGTPELNSYECQQLLNGGGNNNCGSWNNYCNVNNGGGNNNCGSWNNYCNGNNGGGNNNCGSWNNYCNGNNNGGPLQQILGAIGGRKRITSTRN